MACGDPWVGSGEPGAPGGWFAPDGGGPVGNMAPGYMPDGAGREKPTG